MGRHGLAATVQRAAPDADLNRIRAYATRLMDHLAPAFEGRQVVFNATGGNKLMTLGFVEALRHRVDRIIYTDTAHSRIEVIHDRHRADPQPEPMWDVLDVPSYLAVQGFRYHGSASDDAGRLSRILARREMATGLAQEARRQSRLIGVLNALVRQAMDDQGRELRRPVQRLNEPLHREWRTLFDRFMQGGLLTMEGTHAVRFSDLEAARFLGGGWLEEYAYATAKEAGLYDVRMGVEGLWEGTITARNEFDVLACHRNRMLFIECKTLRWDHQKENDNEIAYKIKSLSEHVRGLYGATWLITVRKPTQVLAERASRARVQLIGPQSLAKLRELLIQWREQGTKQVE